MMTDRTTQNTSPSSTVHITIIAVSVSVVLCTITVSVLVAYIIKRITTQRTANRPDAER